MTSEIIILRQLSKLSNFLIFLIPALLLSTYNLSIVPSFIFFILSLVFLKESFSKVVLGKFEYIFIFFIVLYFFTALPNVFFENFRGRVLDAPIRFLLFIPIFILFLSGKIKFEIKYLAIGVVVGSFLASLVAGYDWFILNKERVDGFTFSINFGYLSASLFALSLSFLNLYKNNYWKLLILFSTLLSLFCVLSTGTRGAYIAIPVILFIYLSLTLSKKYLFIALIITLSSSVFIAFNYKNISNKERIQDAVFSFKNFDMNNEQWAHTSIGTRFVFWNVAWQGFLDSPLRGKTYQERIDFYNKLVKEGRVFEVRWGDVNKNYAHAHSEYFEALISKGIFGFLATLGVLFTPMIFFFMKKPNARIDSSIRIAGILFIISFMIFGLSEAPLLASQISVYYPVIVIILWSTLRNSIENKWSINEAI